MADIPLTGVPHASPYSVTVATRFGAADAHYPPSGGGHAALDPLDVLIIDGYVALRLVDRLAGAVPTGRSDEQMF